MNKLGDYVNKVMGEQRKIFCFMGALLLGMFFLYLIYSPYNLAKDYCKILSAVMMVYPVLIFQKFRTRAILLFVLLYVLHFLGLCFAYYYITGAFYTVDTIMAILQTNWTEAMEYIEISCPIVMQLTCLALIVLFVLLGKFVFRVEWTECKPKYFVHFMLIFSLLNGYLLYRHSDNVFTRPYVEARNFYRVYAEYENGLNERKSVLDKVLVDVKIKNGVYVLVIGESHNRKHMSCYGYHRQTTPWLDSMKAEEKMVLFSDAYSCSTQTSYVLTYFLTAKNQYNDLSLKSCPSLFEVANAAGYNTVWLSSQQRYDSSSTPYTVAASSAKQQFWNYYDDKVDKLLFDEHLIDPSDPKQHDDKILYDEYLLGALDQVRYTDKMLIVIQLKGSHFDYRRRYPNSAKIFQGDNDVDWYDNSVFYNDCVMSKIYERCLRMPNFKMMIYCSDHGEDVEGGYRHDASIKYTKPMTEIPLYMIASEGFMRQEECKMNKLREHKDYRFTNDLMFNVCLGIMGIKLEKFYEAENDILSDSYNNCASRFRTLYGKKVIE